MSRLFIKNKHIKEIIILISILAASFFLWNTFVLFPIKIIVVFLHEASHAIAALITGGRVMRLNINFNLGGYCEITGGNPFLIGSAGYLGSFIFGSLFFYSAYSKKYGKIIIILISLIIILIAVNLVQDFGIQLLAILFPILLLLSNQYLPSTFNSYLLKSLGIISCIYVVYDIKEDLLTSTFAQSDASMIANITGISSLIWGFLWITISIAGVIFLLRYGYLKGSRR